MLTIAPVAGSVAYRLAASSKESASARPSFLGKDAQRFLTIAWHSIIVLNDDVAGTIMYIPAAFSRESESARFSFLGKDAQRLLTKPWQSIIVLNDGEIILGVVRSSAYQAPA